MTDHLVGFWAPGGAGDLTGNDAATNEGALGFTEKGAVDEGALRSIR